MATPAYLFIIDTEQYAGNFERELCAWCTGQIGDCGVGDEEARDFKQAHPDLAAAFDALVQKFPDEQDCYRPVCLVATPGWLNNGMGFNYRDAPEHYAAALAAYKRDMIVYDQRELEMVERRLAERDFGTGPYGWTEAACKRTRKRLLAKRAEVEACTQPSRFPAYLSVGIGFYREPNEACIELMKRRAADYAAKHQLTVTGFRLIAGALA